MGLPSYSSKPILVTVPTSRSSHVSKATTQVRVVHGRRITIANYPTLASMIGAASSAAFVALTPAGNMILHQKPANHVMIHPAIFFLANGTATVRAKGLVMSIIKRVCLDPEEEDERGGD
jgi:hypothetical protein